MCKGQVNLQTQEHFARAAEYAIYTADVPCALGSAYLQFSVDSAFSHGVCRTEQKTLSRGSGCAMKGKKEEVLGKWKRTKTGGARRKILQGRFEDISD